MKKLHSVGKRLIAIFLILFISSNTYAIIPIRDGNDFVTKAEFDSIIEDFNTNILNYSSGLNTKIDSAVAGYLAGLSGLSQVNLEVGYFASLPSNVSSVTMRPYNSFSYASGYPNVTARLVECGIYQSNYSYTTNGTLSYSPYPSTYYSSRRFITNDNGVYRWQGYTTNYKETFDITWCGYTGSRDTGYNYAAPYMYVYGASVFSTTASSTGNYWTSFYWHVADGNKNPDQATYSTVNTTWNNFTFSNQYDLIYSDYASGSQTANNMRVFIKGNPNNRWFAGSSPSYLTVTAGGSRSGSWTGNIDNHMSYYGLNSSYSTYGCSGYYNYNFFSCGFEPITKWDSIMCYDPTSYTYYDGDTTNPSTLQNYSMISGAVFCPVVKDGEYTWPVEFTNTSEDSTIWLKYGKFTGEPDSSQCIKVSVDGGPEYNSGTIKEGKGVVKFKAEKNGIVFLKWTSGKAINIRKSKSITGALPREED